MAQNLVLNILAKDKTKVALQGVRNGLNNLRTAVFSLQSAIVGIGGGLVIRSLTKVGSEVEDLGVRFNFLFGNVKEGTKAFDNLISFAARVPFSLQEISAASGNLAVVAKDADDLTRILKITGNVAAVTGLDFRQTAEQIQRSFEGGDFGYIDLLALGIPGCSLSGFSPVSLYLCHATPIFGECRWVLGSRIGAKEVFGDPCFVWLWFWL